MPEDKTLQALVLIRDNEFYYARDFGRAMWPDDPGWKRHGKCGHGSGKGVGMRLAAGGFLGRLDKAGLIRKCMPPTPPNFSGWACRLTEKGKQYIKEKGNYEQ